MKNIFTLPNALSASRLIFLPVLIYLVLIEDRFLFLWVYLIIGSTDAFDGYIARKTKQVTEFGKTIDSLADIFFYVATAWFIYRLYPDYLMPNYSLLLGFFGLLALSFVISGILYKVPIMMHTSLLRYAAVLVYALVIFSYFFNTTWFVAFILIFYLIAFLEEILIFVFFPGFDRDAKSIWHLYQTKKSGVLK